VNAPDSYFVAAIGLFVCMLIAVAAYYYVRSRRRPEADWEQLFARLRWIDRNHIAEVALDLVDESGQPRASECTVRLEASRMWNLIGGLKGLEVLEENSDVLIELAAFLQRWYPEAIVIAEQMRLDARELKWHVARLRGADRKGNLQVSFPFYAQRAVVRYYIMTRRVLSLYEAGNVSMLTQLQRSL
jgi:hypothetical protein